LAGHILPVPDPTEEELISALSDEARGIVARQPRWEEARLPWSDEQQHPYDELERAFAAVDLPTGDRT
jgi:hypothetical protein